MNSSKAEPSEEEVRENEERRAKFGYAENLYCTACNGGGFVYPLFSNGKPDYSRVVSCGAPGCVLDQQRAYQATPEYIKTKGVSKSQSFDDFKPVPGSEETLDAFKDIAFNKSAPPMLLSYGKTGNGKTHLMQATAVELLKRGIDCRLWAVADLISDLKQSIPDNSTEALMVIMKTVPALLLDEWGQHYGSNWEVQKLEEIVLARERAGLITIITTNQEPDQPGVMPERVSSRFRDRSQARMILNEAEDYRPKKKGK